MVELLLVMGILATLFGIMTISYFGVQGKNYLAQGLGILASDMRSQQTKAMTGVTSGGAEQAGYGIHFGTDSYTLFSGDTYTGSGDEVKLPAGVTFTADTFPGQNLIYLRASGEMKGYVNGQDYYVDMTSTSSSSETARVRVNKLGVITEGI